MNAEELNNVIAKAQKLMLDEEFNRKVESKANSFSGRSGGNGYGNDLKSLEAQVFNRPQPRQQVLSEQTKAPTPKIMPAFIDNSQSVIQDITKNLTTEQTVPQVQYSSNAGIDYSLIKSLIDESINRHLEQLKGNLNEGTVKGVKIGKGNTIQLYDTKGNVYEGVLKLKKKAQV